MLGGLGDGHHSIYGQEVHQGQVSALDRLNTPLQAVNVKGRKPPGSSVKPPVAGNSFPTPHQPGGEAIQPFPQHALLSWTVYAVFAYDGWSSLLESMKGTGMHRALPHGGSKESVRSTNRPCEAILAREQSGILHI